MTSHVDYPGAADRWHRFRVYQQPVERGLDEREVRGFLVKAGFEPF